MLIFNSFIPIFAANFEHIMSFLRFKTLLVASFSLMVVLCSTSVYANNLAVDAVVNADTNQVHKEVGAVEHTKEGKEKEEGSFNVTETILEHIKDDHSWHLWGHTSIHLPVILKTSKGFEVFSSEKFVNEHHEPVVYKGNFDYKLIEGKTKIVDANGNLDEATSSIDTESEQLIERAIETLIKGRTSIVIAHRLSTIRKAHKIVVLDRGEIQEMGTHNELLQLGGFYATLTEMQFKQVKDAQKI